MENNTPSIADTKAMFMADIDNEIDDETDVEFDDNSIDTSKPIPTVVTDTTVASDEPYIPLLPSPVQSDKKRLLILDTETTGFHANDGDRIIEIGVVEVINRKFTGEKLHVYIDPERDMDAGAFEVHGISTEFLQGKPKFAEIAQPVFDFLKGGEIIAHNAPFDMSFLIAEFEKANIPNFANEVTVLDTLALAKTKYPGQKNSLDALVKRLEIVTKDRTFHGALLDAEILADVYLTMTGGQVTLSLGETTARLGKHSKVNHNFAVHHASSTANTEHEQWLKNMADAFANDDFLSNWGLIQTAID